LRRIAMKIFQRPAGFIAVLALAFALILSRGVANEARAAAEDVAMFYDDLSQYGQWAKYENYGPVWRPGQVSQDWQPYTNGRWVPTDNGYVFESQEPWGWATYHYGNWMPTQENGWVWVPGRTWYPSTVEWRTSPEDTPPDDSYVGWAPIPPPDYVPPQEYVPPSYNQGNPIGDALTAPFWIFVKAASFLLGLGQPYAPAYSYAYSGVLVPPSYVQVFYPQTVIVQRYYTPAYYPPAYFGGRRLGFAAYNWGPPPAYFYRTARINPAAFNRAIHNNSVYITRIHNVVPPRGVINRYRYLRQIMPPALAQGRALPPPRRITNYRTAQANLYRPNALPAPRQVPRITAPIPKLTPAAGFQPGHKPSPRQIHPGNPGTPGIHAQPGHVPPGEFRSGPPRAVAPRAAQPRPTPVSSGQRVITPAQQQQERYQRQHQQEVRRQHQQPREQQVRQQQLPRQQQIRHQPAAQEIQRRRPPQFQQQQYQRAQHEQVRPQVRSQPAPRPQPHVQPRPQPQHQQQQRERHQESRHRQNQEQ
jgi:hypothetical protein